MADLETIQEYLDSADQWLTAAERAQGNEDNPAAFNALHAVELIAKAAIKFKTGETYKTHRIGGAFGKFFRDELGKDICKELNKKMMRYDGIRYPNGNPTTEAEAKEIVEFSKRFQEKITQYIQDKEGS